MTKEELKKLKELWEEVYPHWEEEVKRYLLSQKTVLDLISEVERLQKRVEWLEGLVKGACIHCVYGTGKVPSPKSRCDDCTAEMDFANFKLKEIPEEK